MATLVVNGTKVNVDDSFLTLPREEQDRAVEEISTSLASRPGIAEDVAKSGGIGLAKGAIGLAGIPGDLQNAAPMLGGWIDEKFGFKGPKLTPEQAAYVERYRHLGAARMPSSGEIKSAVEGLTGKFYEPKTEYGRAAQTVGEMVPAAAIGPGGLAAKGASAVGAGLGSYGAGRLTEGTPVEPYARVIGGVVGTFAPSMIAKAISPSGGAISANRQHSLDVLQREGVGVTAGQATGRKGLQYREAELGGRAVEDAMTRQGEQFTQAAMSRVGSNANRATADAVDAAFTRIGGNFDALASRNTVVADSALGNNLVNVHRNYMSLVNESARKPIVADTIRDIGDAFAANRGQLPGDAYQSITSRLAAAARGTADNELRDALYGIRGALDSAMARSIARNNPADIGAWQEARRQYRNMLVIEKAATAAGEKAAEGIISPSSLRNAVKSQGVRAYATGKGDFAELARAGEAIMKPLPNSGTAQRLRAQGITSAIGAALGGGVGGSIGGGLGGSAGAALGLMAPAIAGRALMSAPVQAYLRNQLMVPHTAESAQRALMLGLAMPSVTAR